jgi:hypothetical protein
MQKPSTSHCICVINNGKDTNTKSILTIKNIIKQKIVATILPKNFSGIVFLAKSVSAKRKPISA